MVSGAALFGEPFSVGMGVWARFHHGPNTLQLTPGLAISGTAQIGSNFELRGRLFTGTMYGYAAGISADACYLFSLASWRPGAGFSVTAAFGNALFFTSSGTEYVYPNNPELGFGVVLIPLRFETERVGYSILEVTIGTDVLLPGQIALIDVELFRLFVKL